jgi:hypothetical protein
VTGRGELFGEAGPERRLAAPFDPFEGQEQTTAAGDAQAVASEV